MLIDFETASKLIRYEQDTGKLFWLRRSPDMFRGKTQTASERSCKTWNTRFADKEAFTARNVGYGYGAIFNKLYLAHRICWLLQYGSWPSDQIDHINGDRSDNRICNLRAVSNAENCKNQSARLDNSTGVVGVYWFKRDQRWIAAITADGQFYHLGYHDSFQSAVEARKTAEEMMGFHPNHGRAAA